MRDVVKVHKLCQVPIFNAVLGADVLMLVMKVFAKFGEADCGKSLLVE